MGIYSVPAKRQGLDLMVSDHKMLNTWDFFLSRIEKKTHYFLVDIRQRKDEWLCYYNAQKDLNGISLTIRKSVKLSLRLKAIIFQVRFPTASSQTVPALVPTPHAQHCNCTRQWEPAPEWAWDIPLATVPLPSTKNAFSSIPNLSHSCSSFKCQRPLWSLSAPWSRLTVLLSSHNTWCSSRSQSLSHGIRIGCVCVSAFPQG